MGFAVQLLHVCHLLLSHHMLLAHISLDLLNVLLTLGLFEVGLVRLSTLSA